MSKKSAYSIMQVSWGEILISPEKSSKQIRFSDGTNNWTNTNNFVLNIPDDMIGHVCVFAKCVVGGDLVVELGGNVPADTGTEIYFLLYDGNREDKYKSFIPRKNHTDFVLNFDSIQILLGNNNNAGEVKTAKINVEGDSVNIYSKHNMIKSAMYIPRFEQVHVKFNHKIGTDRIAIRSCSTGSKNVGRDVPIRNDVKGGGISFTKLFNTWDYLFIYFPGYEDS